MLLVFGTALLIILIAITVIDVKSFTIPDSLSIALLSLGIAWLWNTDYELILSHIVFAVSVGLFFWLVRFAHMKLTHRVGLGMGDVKLAGAGALWFDPLSFPLFLFISSISGLSAALVMGANNPEHKIPFGPFLGAGIFATWIINNVW